MTKDVVGGNILVRYFSFAADSSLEEYERAVVSHLVFLLQSANSTSSRVVTKGRMQHGIL